MRATLTAVALMALAFSLDARERLEIRVRPAFSFAPAELHLEFRVEPDRENRALEVSAESESFYRSSLVTLEGERAQRLVSIRYQGLPAGEYNVRGTLFDSEGHERVMVERRITVMATGDR